MSDTTKLPELLTCGCCFADIQTISASLYHVGHTKFNCVGGPTDTDVKYLKLQKQGIGTVTACGEWSVNKKNLTQTWTIDPFTGTNCYNGDTGTISYLCGTLDSCTATQKNYKCGSVTGGEKENFCTEENFEKTAQESLSNPYTIDDVANNVDTAINAFNFSNPKGTFGTVQFGTNGNKVLQWSASGGTPESRFTYLLDNQGNRNGVYKQKSRVKILKDGFLTKITELESGEITEEAIEVTKNQIIILDPPSEPGKIYFIPYCSTKYLNTNVKTSCSGGLTTKTDTNNCTYFTGPDCKLYNTRIETIQGSYDESYKGFLDKVNDQPFPANGYHKETWNLNHKYEACPSTNQCQGSKKVETFSSNIDTSIGGDTYLVNCTNCYECEGTLNGQNLFPGNWPKFALPAIYTNCDQTTSEPICNLGAGGTCKTVLTNKITNYTKNISENSITQVNTIQNWNYTNDDPSHSGPSWPSDVINGNGGGSITLKTTFSNNSQENWKTETSSNCNSCGSWYVTHNFESKRTATVSMEASFQAPDVGKNSQGNPNPPKNYITYVQRVRREDDTSKQDCLEVTYVSDIITHNSTSSGGEVKVPVPSVTLKSEKDLSDCLVHVSAITFEVE